MINDAVPGGFPKKPREYVRRRLGRLFCSRTICIPRAGLPPAASFENPPGTMSFLHHADFKLESLPWPGTSFGDRNDLPAPAWLAVRPMIRSRAVDFRRRVFGQWRRGLYFEADPPHYRKAMPAGRTDNKHTNSMMLAIHHNQPSRGLPGADTRLRRDSPCHGGVVAAAPGVHPTAEGSNPPMRHGS